MKKYLALALAFVMCFALLAGCGAKTEPEGSTNPEASPSTEGELYEQAKGKTYIVGTDTTFAPFEFENEKGERTGIDYQILNTIAEEMGFTVEWNVLGFDGAVAALESDQVDAVMAGMSIKPERQKKYDFSESYYDSTVAIAVAADSTIADLEGLKGKTVAVKTGTTGSAYAESLAEEYELELAYVADSATMYTYVKSGQADACFEDFPVVGYEIKKGNVNVKVINQSEDQQPYGFAVMKGTNPELIAAFNEGLKRLKDSGKYDEILNTYFGEK